MKKTDELEAVMRENCVNITCITETCLIGDHTQRAGPYFRLRRAS